MTLASSGQLSINDIVGEFGGSGQHGLTEYYRGGSFVPNSSLTQSIPTSGEIKITDFYGTTNYTALSILGSDSWLQSSTLGTSSSQAVTVPSGTQSVIVLGSISTNRTKRTVHSSVTIGGTSLTEVTSTNSPPSEFTFDSAIFSGNFSTTGSQTVTFNYSGSQVDYGSGHAIIFLNKSFSSTTASDSDGANDLNVSSHTLTIDKFGEGIHVGTATVRNLSVGMTNMDTVINMASPSSTRNYLFGFGISSGSYNASSSLATAASSFDTNFGETFAVASFGPTKFNN